MIGSALAATLTLTPGQDLNISNGFGENSNWNSLQLLVNWGCGGQPGCITPTTSQGLIQFDISGIPVGATINSATLRLFHSFNNGLGDSFELYRNTSSWDETTTTYNTRPGADATAVGSLLISDTNNFQYREMDVTGVVQDWYDLVFPNYGLTLRQINEVAEQFIYFESKDHGQPNQIPELVVEYTVNAVPEPGTFTLLACGACALLLRRRYQN